jgi:hypothetical protein
LPSEPVGLDPFIKHLRTHRGLFAALPYFQFVYVSTASKEQDEAAELFALLIQGKGLGDLLRYFDLKKWHDRVIRMEVCSFVASAIKFGPHAGGKT